MRPRKIIMVDEQADPLPGIAEVDEHGSLDALAPQGSPEALDLTERLRPPRRRHDLLDAALLQLAREGALAPPRHVLRTVVGQDLLGHAVTGQRRAHHLDHQGRRLAGMQPVADDEPAVIVHKSDQKNSPILSSQNETEKISLPERI